MNACEAQQVPWCAMAYPCSRFVRDVLVATWPAGEWPNPSRPGECDPSSGPSCTACGPDETCSTAPEALP